MNPILQSFGWSVFFESQREQRMLMHSQIARVAVQHKTEYLLLTISGDRIGTVAGRLRHDSAHLNDLPKIGDWVSLAEPVTDANERVLIQSVLDRKGVVSRRMIDESTGEQIIATNIDVLFIVQGLDNNFDVRRLERYLTVATRAKAQPVILFTKADLISDPAHIADLLQQAHAVAGETPIISLDAHDTVQVKALLEYIAPGNTAALVGSSGVGKSTITNVLLGAQRQATGAVRAADDRGKHTTTVRELVMLPNGGLLIDTPGMRELGLQADTVLDDTFAEVLVLLKACRFSNCTHTGEPGCAIVVALGDGTLAQDRWAAYQKLAREQAFMVANISPDAQRVRQQKTKKMTRELRQILRDKYE